MATPPPSTNPDEYDNGTLLRLLFTLLDRKELAAYINSLNYAQGNVGLPQDVAKHDAKEEKLQSDVLKYSNAICGKVVEILSPASGLPNISLFRLSWFADIMSTVSLRRAGNGHIMALVLCMAQRIQFFELHTGRSVPWRTFQVLRSSWADSANPFKNLQHFALNGLGSHTETIAILPTYQTPEINSALIRLSLNGTIFDYPLPMPVQPILRRVQFTTTTNITPAAIQMMVKNSAMSNLKELVVDDCGRDAPYLTDDLRGENLVELLRSLEKYTPLLELFQWSTQRSDRPEGYTLFDTFKGLKHLRKLHVDIDLLVPYEDTKLNCLSNPHAIFPEHLEELTLDAFRMRPLHKVTRAFHGELEEAENMSEALRTSLATLAAMFPLKRLSLIVPMESESTFEEPYRTTMYELDPMDVTFFRYAANELKKLGVTLEVFRKAGCYERSEKLLVKAGWTAPLPHSVLLTQRKAVWRQELRYDDDSDE